MIIETRLGKYRRKIAALCLAVSIAITAIATTPVRTAAAPDSFAGGSGTQADPFLISSANELAQLNQFLLEANQDIHYRLTTDLHLNEEWVPIGNAANAFYGKLDGANKTITGLSINQAEKSYMGLFGNLAGSVSDLTIETASAGVIGKEYTGIVAGKLSGTLQNVTSNGHVSGTRYTGGIAGRSTGKISFAMNKSKVNGAAYAGGIAGETTGIIENSKNQGFIKGDAQIGGITGQNKGTLSYAENTGSIEGASNVGGIAGINVKTIQDAQNTGAVKGQTDSGGITGNNDSGASIQYSINQGSVAGKTNAGGVAGFNFGSIAVSANEQTVSGTENVGGIAGHQNTGSIMHTYNTGKVQGEDKVGGITGYNEEKVNASFNAGSVIGKKNTGGVHGLSTYLSGTNYSKAFCAKENNSNKEEKYGIALSLGAMTSDTVLSGSMSALSASSNWKKTPNTSNAHYLPYLVNAKGISLGAIQSYQPCTIHFQGSGVVTRVLDQYSNPSYYGESFGFAITPMAGYEISGLVVQVNGSTLSPQNPGIYLIPQITGPTTIAISGAQPIQPTNPTPSNPDPSDSSTSGGASAIQPKPPTESKEPSKEEAEQRIKEESKAVEQTIEKAIEAETPPKVVKTKSTGEVVVAKKQLEALGTITLRHDTQKGKSVRVRVEIKNPEKITRSLKLSGYVDGIKTQKAEKKVKERFNNSFAVVSFDQSGKWGQRIKVAAKVKLSTTNSKKLYFYAYDAKNNKYIRLKNTKHKIDKNGYVHFYTAYAGDIIISVGPLTKR